MVEYMRKVLLPLSYSNEQSIYGESSENNTAHYLNGLNYMSGIRLTLKKIEMVPNSDKTSNQVFTSIRAEDYTTADATYKSEHKEPIGTTKTFYYTRKNSFNNKGGYVHYFPGDITKSEALNMFDELIENNWFTAIDTLSVTTELVFYNGHYKSGLYLAISFIIPNAGTAIMTETVEGFQPQLYDDFISDARITWQYLLQAVFQVLVYYEVLRLLMRFTCTVIYIVTGKKGNLKFSDLIATGLMALCLTSIVYWYKYIVGTKNTFRLPLDINAFNTWVKYSRTMQSYFCVNAISIILMCMRALVELHIEFPTFGTLFATIGSAKFELLSHMVITVVLLLGFAFAGYLLFGYYASEFNTLKDSLMATFLKMFGRPNYEEMSEHNKSFAFIFIIAFLIVFSFFVLKAFTAIFVSQYGWLRKRSLLKIEANARIAKEEGKKFTKKIFDLLLCRSQVQEAPEPEAEPSSVAVNVDPDVLQRKKEVQKKGISVWETMKANATALCSSQPKTQEQIKSRYESMLKTLKNERLAAKQVTLLIKIGGETSQRAGDNKLHNGGNNICSVCNLVHLGNTPSTVHNRCTPFECHIVFPSKRQHEEVLEHSRHISQCSEIDGDRQFDRH